MRCPRRAASSRLRGRATSKSLHGSLRRKKGWYLATGGLRLDDGTEIAIAELTQGAVVAGGRFVRLPNGDYVAIEERVRRPGSVEATRHAQAKEFARPVVQAEARRRLVRVGDGLLRRRTGGSYGRA